MSDSIEQVVGGLALDLIGGIRTAMEADGDVPEDFNVSGAYLIVTAEKEDGSGWHFAASMPDNLIAKLGLTDMAYDRERGKVPGQNE